MNIFGEDRTIHCGEPLSIESLHRIVTHSGFSGTYHYHDYLELLYCVRGEFEIVTFDERMHIRPGDMVLVNSGTPHGICYLSDSSEHYCVKFTHSILFPEAEHTNKYDHFMNALANFRPLEFFDRQTIENDGLRIKENFPKIHGCFLEKSCGWELLTHAYVLQIMTFVFRQRNMEPAARQGEQKAWLNKRDIDGYIKRHLASVSLSEMAKRYYMSYSYFSKSFKRMFAVSFQKYLIKMRINEAMRLLSETDLSVTAIALAVGFSTSSHFIKVFREEKNISPGKFRQKTNRK